MPYATVLGAVREALFASELTPAEKHALLSTIVERVLPKDDDTILVRLKTMADSVNNIEIIRWLRRWDDWSEDELGIPDNAGRTMMTEERREELPSR
jgi:hypothetical protein